jgi:hypothetical protein
MSSERTGKTGMDQVELTPLKKLLTFLRQKRPIPNPCLRKPQATASSRLSFELFILEL